MGQAGEMVAEMARVLQALSTTNAYLAGLDQADAARRVTDTVAYSPLRTLVSHAEEAAERVITYLREQETQVQTRHT